MPLNNAQRLRVGNSEVESSYRASHTRQKPKRGEDVFNAKIARIKWKKGLSVTCSYLNQALLQYNPEHQTRSRVTFNVSFTRLLLWKHGSIMMHEISQTRPQLGQRKGKWVWNVGYPWSRTSATAAYYVFSWLLLWRSQVQCALFLILCYLTLR